MSILKEVLNKLLIKTVSTHSSIICRWRNDCQSDFWAIPQYVFSHTVKFLSLRVARNSYTGCHQNSVDASFTRCPHDPEARTDVQLHKSAAGQTNFVRPMQKPTHNASTLHHRSLYQGVV